MNTTTSVIAGPAAAIGRTLLTGLMAISISFQASINVLADEVEEAKLQKFVDEHNLEVVAALTRDFKPSSQATLDSFRVNGRALNFMVSKAVYGHGTLAFEWTIFFAGPEQRTYGLLRGYSALDMRTTQFVANEIQELKAVSFFEIAAIHGGWEEVEKGWKSGEGVDQSAVASAEPSPTPTKSEEPSFYERHKEDIDKAAIGLGTAAAGILIEKSLNALLDSLSGNQ